MIRKTKIKRRGRKRKKVIKGRKERRRDIDIIRRGGSGSLGTPKRKKRAGKKSCKKMEFCESVMALKDKAGIDDPENLNDDDIIIQDVVNQRKASFSLIFLR